jgi:hypothetical protein
MENRGLAKEKKKMSPFYIEGDSELVSKMEFRIRSSNHAVLSRAIKDQFLPRSGGTE